MERPIQGERTKLQVAAWYPFGDTITRKRVCHTRDCSKWLKWYLATRQYSHRLISGFQVKARNPPVFGALVRENSLFLCLSSEHNLYLLDTLLSTSYASDLVRTTVRQALFGLSDPTR